MNFPLHANGLQAADYLQVSSFKNCKFLQKHRETNNIERRPGSSGLTKETAAMKALVEQQMRDENEVNDRALRSSSNRAQRSSNRAQ